MNNSIFAIATSTQRSALHTHRISGKGVFEILLPYLKYPSKKSMSSRGLTMGSMHFPFTQYVCIYDEHHAMIDDVVITFFRSPKSFTGEDLIEISCHGNPIISQKLQSLFRFIGFRDAQEGEFTQRAFLHGKLDLAQAEAIRELIHAETYGGVQLSRNQLNGDLSVEIAVLREKFTEVLSYLEAHIDFAPDEVGTYEPSFLVPKLKDIFERLNILKKSYVNGVKLKEGLKIVLCGSPNVGKSTLYNKLLNSDHAIVTNIPGTTRDVLTERLVIDRRDFILMDTAGLRKTKNTVEKLGVERSLKALQEADIICAVIDGTKTTIDAIHMMSSSGLKALCRSAKARGSHGLTAGPSAAILDPAVKPRGDTYMPQDDIGSNDFNKVIFVISKTDLINESKIQKIKSEFQTQYANIPIIFVSQNDIASLEKALVQKYDELLAQSNSSTTPSPILISARTHDKVSEAMSLLEEVFVLLNENDLPEKIASTLYSSLKKLEEILGEFDIDQVYQKIFSTFCIGK